MCTGVAHAATITVDSVGPSQAGSCNLPDAITAANTNLAKNGCAAGAGASDRIEFVPALASSEVELVAAQEITSPIVIAGAPSGDIVIIGADAFSLFNVRATGDLTLQDLTLANGRAQQGGGAVWMNDGGGALTATHVLFRDNSVVSDNTTDISGGAVFAGAATNVTLTDCTFRDNTADALAFARTAYGGAVSCGATCSIDSCTFDHNQIKGTSAVGYGGAVNVSGSASVRNATFYNNRNNASVSCGGAVGGAGSMDIVYSTFANNVASTTNAGPSVCSSGGVATVDRSILVGGMGGSAEECAGASVLISNSLIAPSSVGSCMSATLVPGTLTFAAAPTLHEGRVPTLAIARGSAAVDTVSCATAQAVAVDARDVSRPQGPSCDVGAFELRYTDLGTTLSGPTSLYVPGIGSPVTLSLSVTISGASALATPNVKLFCDAPTAVTFASGSGPFMSACTNVGGDASCTFASVAAGASLLGGLSFSVPVGTQSAIAITCTLTSDYGETTADFDRDNHPSVTVPVRYCGDSSTNGSELCDDAAGPACNGTCTGCTSGYENPSQNCQDCADGYAGPTCVACAGGSVAPLCSGHGSCRGNGAIDPISNAGACDCALGFINASCNACGAGFAGASCAACPKANGLVCNGHGSCAGDGQIGYAAGNVATCSSCQTGWANGPAGACEVCAPGFMGASCNQCAPGFYGPSCLACPSANSLVCGGHGQCIGSGNIATVPNGGTCSCDPTYSGTACSASCGDGQVSGTEACDPGPAYESAQCNHDCTPKSCGDGKLNVAAGEECDRGPATPAAGCASGCKLSAGYTCDVGGVACVESCGTFYDFHANDGGFRASNQASTGAWKYGVTSGIFAGPGWETGLAANVPTSAFTTQLKRRVAIPKVTSARATHLLIDYELDGGGDCLRVYLGANEVPDAPSKVAENCGTGNINGDTFDIVAPTSATDQTLWLVIEYSAQANPTTRRGAFVGAITLASDADHDNIMDFASLACGDTCVDADQDGYGDINTTHLPQTCAQSATDCNDDNAAARPGVLETCNDLVDNDCNGFANPADDPYCVEDCGNFTDDAPASNPAKLTDCQDPVCDSTLLLPPVNDKDPMCSVPCALTWEFDRKSASYVVPLGEPAIFVHNGGLGRWATTGLNHAAATRQVGHMQLKIPFGPKQEVGPAPTLSVRFSMAPDTTNGSKHDLFGLCIGDGALGAPACTADTAACVAANPTTPCLATIQQDATTLTTKTVDLTGFTGKTALWLVFVYDTIEAAVLPAAATGVIIEQVRVGSDGDGDGLYEGVDRHDPNLACDPCWDTDFDFYGDPLSPDQGTCPGNDGRPPSAYLVDCDDTRANVRPGYPEAGSCADGLDNDCDGLTDGLDFDSCGTEDCADGVDNNGDGKADCQDLSCTSNLACGQCIIGYTFDLAIGGGTNGWDPTGRIGTAEAKCHGEPTLTAPCPFEVGRSNNLNATGWAVNPDSTVGALGTGRIRSWLTRTIDVPLGMPEPALDVSYIFQGDGTNHTWGVCFDVASPTACNPGQPANIAYSSKKSTPLSTTQGTWLDQGQGILQRTDAGTDRVVIPLSRTGQHTVVIFFDTVGATTPAANNVSGLFVDKVAFRSDIDLDEKGENSPASCDKCIDKDRDGFGAAVSFGLLDTCDADASGLDEVLADCDDNDPNSKPSLATEFALNACYRAGDAPLDKDNNCDGKLDSQDPACARCGNGFIDVNETCDDGQTVPTSGDGCSSTCQVETEKLYLTEIHLPIIFGSSAEQWIELYNGTASTFDFGALDLGIVLGDRCPTDASGTVLDRFPFDDTKDNADGTPNTSIRCLAMGFTGPSPECDFTSTGKTLAPHSYFVVNFGNVDDASFSSTGLIDASCLAQPALSPLGDIVQILLKTGSTWKVTDTVDFRKPTPLPATNWTCELNNYRTDVGRSFMLKSPTNSNDTLNDSPASWCLAGALVANRYSSSDRHYGSPGTAGSCGELACDGVDDDCDGVVDQLDQGVQVTVVGDQVTVTPPEAILFDADGDGVCSQFTPTGALGGRDCLGLVPTCSQGIECTKDSDGDLFNIDGTPNPNGRVDCADGCNDFDLDGFGVTNANVAANQACIASGRCSATCTGGADCDDLNADARPNNPNPEGTQSPESKCFDRFDQDCDGAIDCLDSGCESRVDCKAETCGAQAVSLSCGQTLVVSPKSADFKACASGTANENDLVYTFTPTIAGTARVFIDNLGSQRYELRYYEGNCDEAACPPDEQIAQSNCITGGTLVIPNASKTKTYYIVAKQVGTCQNGTSKQGRLRVACAEDCVNPGFDEDGDGLTDCADPDCVVPGGIQPNPPGFAAPAALCSGDQLGVDFDDFDADGVSNFKEWLCQTNPLVKDVSPGDDRFQNPDGDSLLNCIDPDDDNDGAPDTQELAQCLSSVAKNNASQYPKSNLPSCTNFPSCIGAAPIGDQGGPCIVGADVNCNKQIDTTESACGKKEALCGNQLDDDEDGLIDCADNDCVPDPLCQLADWDGDGANNQLEIQCNTNPENNGQSCGPGLPCAAGDCVDGRCLDGESIPTLEQRGDPDLDLLPSCVDTDDDGDTFSDVEERLCGSNPLLAASVPLDTDHDTQCNAVDTDDDNDGFPDVLELQCGSDPLLASSKPTDTAFDQDHDGECNATDADDDDDTWPDLTELDCLTDPLDASDNPTANGQDVDQDRLCDRVDPNDDNDSWPDALEIACGTDPRDADSVPPDCDHDFICDALDTDDDGDEAPDAVEVLCGTNTCDPNDKPLEIETIDTDHDGTVNCVDTDDDDDGLSDVLELTGCEVPVPRPASGPTCTDPKNKDSDGDHLDDGVEDANHNGLWDQASETSPARLDSDADGLDDGVEAASCYLTGLDPNDENACLPTLGYQKDTDLDGLPDGFEDADGNGAFGPGETNPVIADTDGDGFIDGEEIRCLSNPLDPTSVPLDVNDNGACDGAELDSDLDHVPDAVEIFCHTNPEDAESVPTLNDLLDTDGDGDINCVDVDDDNDQVSDLNELECGTNPRDATKTPTALEASDYDQDGLLNCSDADDDDDSLSDVDELARVPPTNPLDQDSDDDGLADGAEVRVGLDPTDPDSDHDGVQDGTESGRVVGTPDTDSNVFVPDLGSAQVTDPLKPDTDGDGLKDGEEDLDGNGRIDEGETDPLDPTDGLLDTDHDSLIDRDERQKYHTDPLDPDTDGDGLDDGLEVNTYGSDPNDPDTDKGGIVDGQEIENHTSPTDPGDDFTTATIRGDNVFGCHAGDLHGGEAMTLLSILGALAFITRGRLRRLLRRGPGAALLTLVIAGSLAAGSDAHAQQGTPDVNVEQFTPVSGKNRIWSVEDSDVGAAWKPWVGLTFFGERNSLVLTAGQHEERLIANQQVAELGLGIGIADILQVELNLPFVVGYESGQVTSIAGSVDAENPSGQTYSGGGISDMRLRVRGKILDNRLGGFGLGASLGATFPTGDGAKFRGDPSVGILFSLIADYRVGGTVLALNLGTRIRTEESKFIEPAGADARATFGNELYYGLGLDVEVAPSVLWLGTELFGRTDLSAPFDDVSTSGLEVLFGPKWQFVHDFQFQAAAGAGLVQGRGTPDFRFLFALQWAPSGDDEDGDGVPDDVDRCPRSPEDLDGFADHDGCPDPDNDNDGILDVNDKCPLQRETFDGIDDDDGCPETETFSDQDMDGIPDDRDQCPLVPETINGVEDGDGCPDPDRPNVVNPGTGVVDPECDVRLSEVIYFVQDSAELSEESKQTLVKVADKINNTPLITFVSINGHTSEEGGDEKNLRLSQDRAKRVKAYLHEQVIDQGKMAARGYGEHAPRVDISSPEADRENRAVDFVVELGGKCKR